MLNDYMDSEGEIGVWGREGGKWGGLEKKESGVEWRMSLELDGGDNIAKPWLGSGVGQHFQKLFSYLNLSGESFQFSQESSGQEVKSGSFLFVIVLLLLYDLRNGRTSVDETGKEDFDLAEHVLFESSSSFLNKTDIPPKGITIQTSHQCGEGREPFVSLEGLEQLHRFLFVLGITHVLYSCLAVGRHEQGLNIYFWLSFIPAIIVMLVGTKLQHVVSTLALEIVEQTGPSVGTQLKPRDDLFWFGKPEILLRLIQFIIFQNAFEMATFIWSLVRTSPLRDELTVASGTISRSSSLGSLNEVTVAPPEKAEDAETSNPHHNELSARIEEYLNDSTSHPPIIEEDDNSGIIEEPKIESLSELFRRT
ncbi:hypothetical protein GH714_005296 [Hevea brasiliensis]|uniref:MLO-like protein n=1 Tax=Hevea brasiliensis TaxID=3981 RepID=A0A6A6KXV5_HEVBR|nr:hypothetical protein GH714_005296 [Hevea brasiliensis]